MTSLISSSNCHLLLDSYVRVSALETVNTRTASPTTNFVRQLFFVWQVAPSVLLFCWEDHCSVKFKFRAKSNVGVIVYFDRIYSLENYIQSQLYSQMSFRTKLLALVDVLLRVPPLFIMDELLRIGLGFQQGDSNRFNSSSEADDAEASIIEDALPPIISTYLEYRTYFYKVVVITCLKYILSCLGKLSFPV